MSGLTQGQQCTVAVVVVPLLLYGLLLLFWEFFAWWRFGATARITDTFRAVQDEYPGPLVMIAVVVSGIVMGVLSHIFWGRGEDDHDKPSN
jgi:hypothetical protein